MTKTRVLGSVSIIALLTAGPMGGIARAGEAPAQTSAPNIDEIVVTGSRIVRDGYEAPTPVSVLGAEELANMGVANVADAVNRLPAVANSTKPSNQSATDFNAGMNNLNLRGLSPSRTLVLLDGRRVVGATIANENASSVDINTIPNNLVSRVDVVTGGASAVYGSDALAGVVNFVLDKEFTGVKGTVEGGITTYGDDENYTVSVAAGVPFAGGRGHILLSGEHALNQGIIGQPRDWADISYSLVPNPTYTASNGQPRWLTAFQTGLIDSDLGGLISSGPLKGIAFGAKGDPYQFNYGAATGGLLMIGGDWRSSRIDQSTTLDLYVRRDNLFVRSSYDLADNFTVYGEWQWANTLGTQPTGSLQVINGNLTVLSGNPFIPASVQAQMTALGLTSFTMGRTNADLGTFHAKNERTLRRYVVGAEGSFDAGDTTWNWDVSALLNTTHISARTPNDMIRTRYNLAVDSVLVNGRAVCRINADTNPANDDSRCTPFNPMGIDVNTQGAIDFVTGTGYSFMKLKQTVIEASASGEPFSIWAGPVSLAFGAEHREESVGGFVSALDQARQYFAGNFSASVGSFKVNEAFVETVVPLARDTSWAQSLDLNAAVRATDYSTSGYVTTWKAGLTYTPIDDISFRATRSRDIRAPNLGELFNGGSSGTGPVVDPIAGISRVIVSRVGGNPNLLPEKSDTTGLGVILRPSFLPGFTAAVDYYNLSIKGAMISFAAQEYVDGCYQRNLQDLCASITRGPDGVIDFIFRRPVNLQTARARGIDFEATYNLPISQINADWDGNFTLRGLASHAISLYTSSAFNTVEGAGVNADGGGSLTGAGLFAPSWKGSLSATYTLEPFSGTFTGRYTSSGKYNNGAIECTSGCPTSTVINPTINNNYVPATVFFDLALNYGLTVGPAEADLFFVTSNLFDRDPPLIAGATSSNYWKGQANAAYYDRVGRTFRLGVRFKM